MCVDVSEVNIVDRKALNGSLDFTRSLIGLAKTYELKINGKTKLITLLFFSVRDYKNRMEFCFFPKLN